MESKLKQDTCADSHVSNEIMNLDNILTAASFQWLNTSQIAYLLDPKRSPLQFSTFPHKKPPSGTLLLFNRRVTRRYKNDDYNWVKKRNSNKVREDHVKLRLNGKPFISGIYVHCQDNPSLHRRTYHIIDQNRQKFGSSSQPSNDTFPLHHNLVLVHYLDTHVAAENAANLSKRDCNRNRVGIPLVKQISDVTTGHQEIENRNTMLTENMPLLPNFGNGNDFNRLSDLSSQVRQPYFLPGQLRLPFDNRSVTQSFQSNLANQAQSNFFLRPNPVNHEGQVKNVMADSLSKLSEESNFGYQTCNNLGMDFQPDSLMLAMLRQQQQQLEFQANLLNSHISQLCTQQQLSRSPTAAPPSPEQNDGNVN